MENMKNAGNYGNFDIQKYENMEKYGKTENIENYGNFEIKEI